MKLKLRGKLLSIIISLLFVFGIVITYIVYNGVIELVGNNKLTSDINLGYELLNTKFEGEWNIKNRKLYKGDILINDNYEVVDKIKEQTGSLATIFHNDTRVSTNVIKEDGARAVGTKVSDAVGKVVLKDGKVFIGEADVVGKKFITQYIPIKNKDNKIIGMFFVGVEKETVKSIAKPLIIKIILSICIAIILGSIISLVFVNKIINNIKKGVNTLKEVEKGNLTVYANIETNDEIKEIANATNNMVCNIKQLILEVKSAANTIANSSMSLVSTTEQTTSATNEVTRAIEEIAISAGHQAQDIEHGVNEIKELSKNIDLASIESDAMNLITVEASELNGKGLKAVNDLIKVNENYVESTTSVNELIIEMNRSTEKINVITETIGEISEQTNLLALNAAIEAARAGEAGRGFSVVADEIKKLAEQSSQATDEVRGLIEGIQKKSNTVVNALSMSNELFDKQNNSINDTKHIFNSISIKIKDLTETVEKLKAFNKNVIDKKDGIVNVMENISATSQQTSATTQEVSVSAEEQLAIIEEISVQTKNFEELSEKLNYTVEKFKIN